LCHYIQLRRINKGDFVVKKGGKRMSNDIERIREKKKQWEEHSLKPTLDRFGLKESPTRFYTPADVEGFDFLTKVGFPGEYPFTAGTYPTYPYRPAPRRGQPTARGLVRAAGYSGYGTAEDTRDYYKQMQARGQRAGLTCPHKGYHCLS